MFPSIRVKFGFFFNFLIALFIANSVAFKMLSLSISLTEAEPTDQIEFFFIYLSKTSLLCFEIFLESFNDFLFMFFFNITAAA